MSRARLRASLLACVTALAALVPVAPAEGNGETMREVQGRLVAIDRGAGTLVVDSTFRGRTTRVTLRAGPDLAVYACDGGPATLDRVKKGMSVSVFYEVLGAEGVANLVVVEPAP